MAAELTSDMEALRLGVVHATGLAKVSSIALIGLDKGHGTSTVAWGLAQAFAAAEQSVTLIDAHFARPALHKFHGGNLSSGLSETISGATTDAAIDASAMAANILFMSHATTPLLKVISAGKGGAKIAYSRPRWQGVFKNLQGESEFLLVDAGCIQEPTALSVTAAVDAVVLVVAANRSPYEAVDHAIIRLRECGANPLGTILNQRRFSLPRFLYRFL